MNLHEFSVEKLSNIPRLSLGESPLWDERQKALYLVDIEGRFVGVSHGLYGTFKKVESPGRCSFLALTDDPSIIVVAVERVIYKLHLVTNSWSPLVTLPTFHFQKNARLNEGYVADDGTLWITSIDFCDGYDACLWNIDLRSKNIRRRIDGLGIGNGMFEFRHQLHLTDSRRGSLFKIEAFTTDLSAASRVLHFENGEPDGCLLSEQGDVWSAIWGGRRLECRGLSAEKMDVLKMPVEQPTSLEAISSDCLVVTSASIGLKNPGQLDGHVLKIAAKNKFLFKKKNYVRIQ